MSRRKGGPWRDTVLAGLANYIDAGSIVAGSAALALWKAQYHLSDSFIGLIAAFSANAISAGVGALIGGRLCDRYGRKKIYQFDMLFYAFGMLWLVFAAAPWMIVVGFLLVGLAVGADIPASWSLIAELAPDHERGKHSGVAQILWYLGPAVVLTAFLVLEPLGVLGARLVFAHLAVLAVVLTLLRSRMRESERWMTAKKQARQGTSATLQLLLGEPYRHSILFLVGVYGFWNLWAGTSGFFFPYILRTVGGQSQGASVAIQASSFLVGILSIGFVFMRFSDRIDHRRLFAVAAILQVIGTMLLAVAPLTAPVAIAYLALNALGAGFGAQSFFQLWSSELFPTLLRSSAQGLMFAVVRIGLGIWSFFVPLITSVSFHALAWILTAFLIASGLIGTIWAPRNEGKSLEAIEGALYGLADA